MDFEGGDKVTLRVGTAGYPMRFFFSPASALGANDGSLPFGATISAATITVSAFGGADITAATVGAAAVDGPGLVVTAAFNYPSAAKKGLCRTLLALTLSTGEVLVKRWDGLIIE